MDLTEGASPPPDGLGVEDPSLSPDDEPRAGVWKGSGPSMDSGRFSLGSFGGDFLSVPEEYAESGGRVYGCCLAFMSASGGSSVRGRCFMRFERRRAKPVLFKLLVTTAEDLACNEC